MTDQRGDAPGVGAKGAKAQKFLGSLKDALMAASRDDTAALRSATPIDAGRAVVPGVASDGPGVTPSRTIHAAPALSLTAEEAAALSRSAPQPRTAVEVLQPVEVEMPPTTRVLRREPKAPARTMLVRGRPQIDHSEFMQDPVVGFLVVVGGPGLGSFRPVFEGNNTIGRTQANRIALDFGDDSISAEEQAYLRYDSADRSFLFVPNLAKTNIVSVNDKRPAGAVSLKAMDVIVLGRTQVAFVPFCGAEFDWSEITEA